MVIPLPLVAALLPLIVRFLLLIACVPSSPMVPLTLKLMVSPYAAFARALTNEPGPLVLVFVTVMVLPKTGDAPASADKTSASPRKLFDRLFSSGISALSRQDPEVSGHIVVTQAGGKQVA